MNRDVGPVTAYADAVLGGYEGTRAQWRTFLANLPHGVFFAQYRVTTYAQVEAALDAGLAVFAYDGDGVYAAYGGNIGGPFMFFNISGTHPVNDDPGVYALGLGCPAENSS